MYKLTHIKQLDGIRAIAALMVMVFHFFQWRPISGNIVFDLIQKLSIFGQTGVSLFFVLSGFLITRILMKSKEEDNYFRNFYMKRVLRIFPLYYLFLFIYYILNPWLNSSPIPPFSNQIVFYTYLQNIWMTFNLGAVGPGHYWSLAVEEHFYLVWPLLVYFASDRNLHKFLFGFIGLSVVLRAILTYYNYEVFYFTLTRLDDISLGALLAIWSVKRNGDIDFFKQKQFFLLFIPLIIITLGLFTAFSGKVNLFMQVFKFVFIGLFYFLFIGYAINNNNWFIRFFANKPLLFLGKISYGLYVYHGLCFGYANKYLKTDYLLFDMFVQFCLAIIVSTISYYAFEKWFLKLKVKYN